MTIHKNAFMRGEYARESLHVLARQRAADLPADEVERRRTRTLTRILREMVNDRGNGHLGPGLDGHAPWTHTDLGRRILDELEAYTARYRRYMDRARREDAWRCLEAAADLVLIRIWLRDDENTDALVRQRLAGQRVGELVEAGEDPFGLVDRFIAGATADELDRYADDLVEELVRVIGDGDLIAADVRRAAKGTAAEDPDALARVLTRLGEHLLAAIAGNLATDAPTTSEVRRLAALARQAAGLSRLIQRAGFDHDGW